MDFFLTTRCCAIMPEQVNTQRHSYNKVRKNRAKIYLLLGCEFGISCFSLVLFSLPWFSVLSIRSTADIDCQIQEIKNTLQFQI